MRRSLTRIILSTALLGAPLWASPAAAQGQQAAADALFNEAQAALEKADYATACQRFRESDRLDPAIGTKLNLAICEEKRGKLATAWDLYQSVIDMAPATDERRAMAQGLAEKLKPRIPTLTIRLSKGAPAETVAHDGDLSLRGASFGVALPMDPGKHTFTVSAPGSDDRTVTIELREGENKEIEVAPRPRKPESSTAQPPSSSIAFSAEAPPTRSNTFGFVVGGIGVAGVGVAGVTGILALGKKSTADANCNDELRTCNQEGKDADSAGRSLVTISTIGWVVGVAGLAGAGAYFVLAGAGDEKPKTALGTTIVPGGATATLSRDW